jgi:hypothetical protein
MLGTIVALSVGSQVSRAPFAGVVHSVFPRACNIELHDGGLLTLLDASCGTVPHGIRLATPDSFDFRDWMPAHERVAGRENVMRFENSRLIVDLRHAIPACTSILQIALDMEKGSTHAAWRAALSQMAGGARPEGLGALFAGHGRTNSRCALTELLLCEARGRIPVLVRAAASFDCDAAIPAAVGAIGMGPGLTPSWDDFLVGFLAGIHATSRGHPGRFRFVARLGEAVHAASSTTTIVSHIQLEHAANGQVSEKLVAMLEAMAEGDANGTIAATAELLNVGSTSGTDTLLGVLAGVAVWQPKSDYAAGNDALSFRGNRKPRFKFGREIRLVIPFH